MISENVLTVNLKKNIMNSRKKKMHYGNVVCSFVHFLDNLFRFTIIIIISNLYTKIVIFL